MLIILSVVITHLLVDKLTKGTDAKLSRNFLYVVLYSALKWRFSWQRRHRKEKKKTHCKFLGRDVKSPVCGRSLNLTTTSVVDLSWF